MSIMKRVTILLALILIAASTASLTPSAVASTSRYQPDTQPRLVVFEGFLRYG